MYLYMFYFYTLYSPFNYNVSMNSINATQCIQMRNKIPLNSPIFSFQTRIRTKYISLETKGSFKRFIPLQIMKKKIQTLGHPVSSWKIHSFLRHLRFLKVPLQFPFKLKIEMRLGFLERERKSRTFFRFFPDNS